MGHHFTSMLIFRKENTKNLQVLSILSSINDLMILYLKRDLMKTWKTYSVFFTLNVYSSRENWEQLLVVMLRIWRSYIYLRICLNFKNDCIVKKTKTKLIRENAYIFALHTLFSSGNYTNQNGNMPKKLPNWRTLRTNNSDRFCRIQPNWISMILLVLMFLFGETSEHTRTYN